MCGKSYISKKVVLFFKISLPFETMQASLEACFKWVLNACCGELIKTCFQKAGSSEFIQEILPPSTENVCSVMSPCENKLEGKRVFHRMMVWNCMFADMWAGLFLFFFFWFFFFVCFFQWYLQFLTAPITRKRVRFSSLAGCIKAHWAYCPETCLVLQSYQPKGNKTILSQGEVWLLCLNQAALLQKSASFSDCSRVIAPWEMNQRF